MTDIYDKQAKKIGEIELPDRLFARPWNPDLVHQALRVQTANQRVNIAHAKGRGEVRGGGKKPWQQKGTGRARHGSIRSPIWVGGGVTHGPTKEKKLGLKLNQKMRQGAIFSILSRRLNEGEIKIVDSFPVELKTKNLAAFLSHFLNSKPNTLLISGVSEAGKKIDQATHNLPGVKTLDPKSLNVYDLLRYKNILVEKEALPVMEKHYHAVR